jgi:predicted amidophosphoribosyltransferase
MLASATLPRRAIAQLRRAGRGLVDVVLPPRCLACGEIVEQPDALCGRCWSSITFFAPPWCAVCGLPFPHPVGDAAVCADCARGQHAWDRARAVFRYDKGSRDLVLGLKHADRTDVAGALGRWMMRFGGEFVVEAELLVPVPLHWTRLLHRRYNQAALLVIRSMPRADRRSQSIASCVGAAPHRKAISGRSRVSAMCAALLPFANIRR